MESREAVIKKIRALFNNNGRTEEEAALYADKARELMDKFNLSEFHLNEGKTESCSEKASFGARSRFEVWMEILFAGVVRSCDCFPFLNRSYGPGKSKVVFNAVGYKSDLELAEYIYEFLFGAIESLFKKELAKVKKDMSYWTRKDSWGFKAAFCLGAARRVVAMVESQRSKRCEAQSEVLALVVARKQEVNNWVRNNMFLFRSKSRNTSGVNGDYYNHGFSAASSISLTRAIK